MHHLVAVLTLMAASAAAAQPLLQVEVMVVGDFHMNNPGHDIHNVRVPDVMAPTIQTQIAAVDAALARFRPTVVAAEWPASIVDSRYPTYLAGRLAPSRDEVVQLGFRLAKLAGASMHGIDVDSDFPYQALSDYAKVHGQQAVLDALNQDIQAQSQNETRLLAEKGVSAMLRYLNDPARIKNDDGAYWQTLRTGGGDNQPGVALLAAWHRRNIAICANLVQVTRPGDRVVVFYGAGHAFLLRQCASEMPGFRLVEPTAFLPP